MLRFDLNQQGDVVEKYDVRKFLAFLLPLRISIGEVAKEGSFEKPLCKLLLVLSRNSARCGDLGHAETKIGKLLF